jgi:hypothetical protein
MAVSRLFIARLVELILMHSKTEWKVNPVHN